MFVPSLFLLASAQDKCHKGKLQDKVRTIPGLVLSSNCKGPYESCAVECEQPNYYSKSGEITCDKENGTTSLRWGPPRTGWDAEYMSGINCLRKCRKERFQERLNINPGLVLSSNCEEPYESCTVDCDPSKYQSNSGEIRCDPLSGTFLWKNVENSWIKTNYIVCTPKANPTTTTTAASVLVGNDIETVVKQGSRSWGRSQGQFGRLQDIWESHGLKLGKTRIWFLYEIFVRRYEASWLVLQ